jgi:signal transduction histidine kinase
MLPGRPTFPRPRRRSLVVSWLAGAVALVVAGLLLAAAAGHHGASAGLVLTEAQFQRLDTAPPAPWRPVALPHTWGADGLPLDGRGHYRLRFALDREPAGPWAVRVDRLSNVHRIEVNGVLVHEAGSQGRDIARPRPVPVLAVVPGTLLRAGENRIDIQWRLGFRAGLSEVQVGPAEAIAEGYAADRLLDQTLPKLMNVAGASLAAFMLLIWWRRPQERAIGLFGALWLLVSLRNVSYFVDRVPWPGLPGDWLFFAAQCVSAALLGAFAVALSGQSWPRYRRVLGALGLGLPVVGVAASALDLLGPLRTVAYPAVVLVSTVALWVLWGVVRRASGRALALLLAGLVLVLAAGVHDYLFLHGDVPVTHFFWLPHVAPPACMWFALVLVNRLVGAMGASERLARELETRVAERTQALEAANQAQSRFLAAASHDLRQPVTAIALLVGLARERAQEPEVRHLLQRADTGVRSLEQLLNGLLDLSRLERGAAPPALEPVTLQPLFDRVAAHAQQAADAKGVRLRVRARAVTVRSEPVLLEQVLRNLVANAVRYTDRGGVLVAVRRHGPDACRLQVWDTGPGIAPEHRQRVFEPFVQLHNPGRERERGQGLGLAIVRAAVDLLGHPLALQSRPGRGSCFSILLPRVGPVGEPDAPVAAPAGASTPAPTSPPLAGREIWLLDDDAEVRHALAARLRAWGARVRVHGRVADLVESLAGHPPRPDLLLTDHRLPDGDAFAAIGRARQQLGAVTALVLTGEGEGADRQAFEALGVTVLLKPVPLDELLHHLAVAEPRA